MDKTVAGAVRKHALQFLFCRYGYDVHRRQPQRPCLFEETFGRVGIETRRSSAGERRPGKRRRSPLHRDYWKRHF